MLDQFYSYLAKNVVKYFEYRKVKSGDKFNIQFEKEEEVKRLKEEAGIIKKEEPNIMEPLE